MRPAPGPIASALVLAAVITVVPAGAVSQQEATIGAVYDAYVTGNYAAPRLAFPLEADLRRARGDLARTIRLWRTARKPSHSAFLLDLALVGFERGWEDAVAVVEAARDLTITRPAAPGVSDEDDAFERALHRAALALLMSYQRLDAADDYLGPLDTRLSSDAAPRAGRVIVDSRAALARGMLLEMRTSPANQAKTDRADLAPSLRIGESDGATRRRAEQAIAMYDRVGDERDGGLEARVRQGFLLFRLGRYDDALERLRGVVANDDPTVEYWSWLFQGRVFETVARVSDASAAYERAAQLFPRAQTPAVALASLFRRHDRPTDSVQWAMAARSPARADYDPWWAYWNGDARMLPAWVAAVRRGRP